MAPHELLQRLFKRFSVQTAFTTALPTLGYYLTRMRAESALSVSDKPALFTMNILPPMMTVWHHCVKKYLGDSVDTVIFDCSGELIASEFPGARVQKFLNFYAATKSQEFLDHIAKNRKISWLCDDDMFIISPAAVELVQRELAVPNTASLSFRPRNWWHFEINGTSHAPSGSYCLALNREIVCDKEHISLAPANGNEHPSDMGKPPKRYDTFDKANEVLLTKGYRCAVVPETEQDKYVTGFSGMSGTVMLLRHFTTPEQTLDFFTSQPAEKWDANVLYGTFSSLLAIECIQECYTTLMGRPYPLRSLPSKKALEDIRRAREPHLGGGRSFKWIDEAGERLKKAL
ncbi:hypothetical protein EXS70_04895 [Candidatus Peribacteria bacterium]|nr:hypothetical protein [Candidatus Peribacteria bacterium]